MQTLLETPPADGAAAAIAALPTATADAGPLDPIEEIRRETEQRIKDIRAAADRRIANAIRSKTPLPQRKTIAYDLLESFRDRVRAKAGNPLMLDTEADTQIKAVFEAAFGPVEPREPSPE